MTTHETITDDHVCRVISEVAMVGPLKPDDVLVDHGIDSMTLVTLILRIEMEFETSIPDAMLTVEAFRTPHAIAATIRMARGGPVGAGQ